MYFVNDYKFHTKDWSKDKSTSNYNVFVQGFDCGHSKNDFYGMLHDVIELECIEWPIKKLVLFKCE